MKLSGSTSRGYIGALVLMLLLVMAYVAPLPYDPVEPDPSVTLGPPNSAHWFGTDRSGFDVFSRTVAAARLDLPLAVMGTLLSALIGVPVGLIASTKSRWAERAMRVVDVVQAFPLLVLAIVFVALTGNSLRNVVLAIAMVQTPRFVRLIRAETLSLRESRFIEAAVALGAPPIWVMFRHLLPNVSGVILAQSSVAAAYSIVVIAGLSFLGIGIIPPSASWGAMIREGSGSIATGQWWVSLFPGLAISISVLAFNSVADAVFRHVRGWEKHGV